MQAGGDKVRLLQLPRQRQGMLTVLHGLQGGRRISQGDVGQVGLELHQGHPVPAGLGHAQRLLQQRPGGRLIAGPRRQHRQVA